MLFPVELLPLPNAPIRTKVSSFPEEIDVILRGIKPTNIIYLMIIKIGRYTTEEKEILKCIFSL
jgi:hypothetical protein